MTSFYAILGIYFLQHILGCLTIISSFGFGDVESVYDRIRLKSDTVEVLKSWTGMASTHLEKESMVAIIHLCSWAMAFFKLIAMQ